MEIVNSETYKELKLAKDRAYRERNQLVAALSRLHPSHLTLHDENDKDWDPEWRTIVMIMIPNMVRRSNALQDQESRELVQLSWHIHESEIYLFDHLPWDTHPIWDGHTTEEKYRRLRKMVLPTEIHYEEKGRLL
jgi:hypothetical protein